MANTRFLSYGVTLVECFRRRSRGLGLNLQVLGGKFCHYQLHVTTEGARAIVRALGGRGFAFYNSPPPKDQSGDFLKALLADCRNVPNCR